MNPDFRARLLAEWRGLEEPPAKPDRLVTIAQALGTLLPSLGLGDRIDEAEIAREWKELVGDFIAANAAPTGLKAGVLQIRVVHPTLRYELDRVWKARILATLQEKFGKGKIRSVRFHL